MVLTALRLNLLLSYEAARWSADRPVRRIGIPLYPDQFGLLYRDRSGKSGSVSGLMNFSRNIGSSVGTSLVSTLLDRRAQYHQVFLTQHTTAFNRLFQNRVSTLAERLGTDLHGYASVYSSLLRQAQTLAYVDTFYLLATMAAMMLALCFLLKRNELGSGAVASE